MVNAQIKHSASLSDISSPIATTSASLSELQSTTTVLDGENLVFRLRCEAVSRRLRPRRDFNLLRPLSDDLPGLLRTSLISLGRVLLEASSGAVAGSGEQAGTHEGAPGATDSNLSFFSATDKQKWTLKKASVLESSEGLRMLKLNIASFDQTFISIVSCLEMKRGAKH